MPSGQNPNARGTRGGYGPPVSMGPAVYDGPASDRGRSRSASRTRTSQPGSRTQSQGPAVPAGLDPKTGRAYVLNRNVDFGGQVYQLLSGVSLTVFLVSTYASLCLCVIASCPKHVNAARHIAFRPTSRPSFFVLSSRYTSQYLLFPTNTDKVTLSQPPRRVTSPWLFSTI